MAEEIVMGIEDMIPDDKNFNNSTERGRVLLERSFDRFGAARSIVIDENNRVIDGNKSLEAAKKAGITKVRIIETVGDVLVAVRRTDIDLDSNDGREMALADNMTAKEGFSLNYAQIKECVDELNMDVEAFGIKDIDKLVERERREAEKQANDFHSLSKAKAMSSTPIKFGSYTMYPTQEEFDALVNYADNYFEENGVVIGLVAELLNI